ncbi:MAG: putative acyltransferase YihG [Glaciecola sp. HTCC2999]|jgi:1-acyl-sn-glycerol-3-phosphate acyltransferase|nr:MAG: putative acyltransferase YihG [Glaciecola sp. HTCC2999]
MSLLRAIFIFPIHFTLQMSNLGFWAVLIVLFGLIKLLIPLPPFNRHINALNAVFEIAFGVISVKLITLFNRVTIESNIPHSISPEGWYLITANHRSYLDIILLIGFAKGNYPAPKFFLKKELIWLPFVGLGAWALDMPFMRRYSKAQIEQQPSLKGKDIATTQAACEKYRNTPTTIINFVEGTRFTPQKHIQKNSPYQYLLPPKAAGIAFTLAAMGNLFANMLDVSIFYPQNSKWPMMDMLCGSMQRIIIDIKEIPISSNMRGNYQEDELFRKHFQVQLNTLWEEKDLRIQTLLQDN